jgi:predicted anti-sigma-YlaC factor YlaD
MKNSRECSGISDLLPEFLAGRLSVEDDRRVRTHLEGCPECRKRANAVSVLQQTPVPVPDPERWDFFVDGVLDATERRNRFLVGGRAWWLGGALVAAAILAFWWIRPGDVPPPRGVTIEALAGEVSELPEVEARAWTVGLGPVEFLPAGFDTAELSEDELIELASEVGRT